MLDFGDALALQMPRLRRYARALTHDPEWADDLVQDTLERALRRRWLFRINTNLTAWLFTILYRLYLNEASRRRTVFVETAEAVPPELATSSDTALQLDMRRALAALSKEHRAVIVLVGLEQLSYRETADILDVPLGTVMSRLARARQHLRILLAGEPPAASVAAASAHLTRIK